MAPTFISILQNTLLKFNSSPQKGYLDPKEKDRLLTIIFPGRAAKLRGSMLKKEASKKEPPGNSIEMIIFSLMNSIPTNQRQE